VKGKRIAKKFNGKCFICNKIGYLVKDCKNKDKQGNPTKRIVQANFTEVDHLTNKVSEMKLSCVVSEVNLINNHDQWWVDTSDTRHVCIEKMMFSTYKKVDEEKPIHEELINL
jgi:uncharacterized membrane-anchored protein YjiN (DUF445 family)